MESVRNKLSQTERGHEEEAELMEMSDTGVIDANTARSVRRCRQRWS